MTKVGADGTAHDREQARFYGRTLDGDIGSNDLTS